MPTDKQKEIMDEIFWLLSEQERSLREEFNAQENPEFGTRAKRIDDLVEQMVTSR